ncbi:hypothetical protein IMSHALPRED_006053 [Imshaugia aleurites]|uniref:Uncharacterized protein n=1 Tax=Imshaugia aleurites TaxID=172621 RepID=A0A8H3FG24_9LECA|nr:hypothetical protein IMSHALPRED_006053 [Imshaugia aleurites]
MPWGETAEISAADVRGVTLHEMTRRISAILTPKYQAKRALEKEENLAKQARKKSEATATSADEAGLLTAGEEGTDVLAAVSDAPTGNTEAIPTHIKTPAIPDTVSAAATGVSKDDVVESSEKAFDVSPINEPTSTASTSEEKP